MKRLAALSLIIAYSGTSVLAATGPVTFTGTVTATCTLLVNSNGTMTPSADLRTVSSKHSGAVGASVGLTSTGNVTLKVDPVASAIIPAGDITPTTWKPSYSLAGVQNIANTENATPITVPGSGVVTVHLEGTKGVSDSFVPGLYSAVVTVRCE